MLREYLKSCQLGAYILPWNKSLPEGWRCCVEGTLGRFNAISWLIFPAVSGMPSLDLRLLTRAPERFSTPSLMPGFASLAGASEGVAIAVGSSLGELEVFDDECLRWCMPAEDRPAGLDIKAWEVLLRAEQDRQVQVLLRASSFE